MGDVSRTSPARTGVAPVLRVTGLSKRYGSAQVLERVSFDVASGTVVALLGANGAGKTTTLKCILGVVSFEGDIEIGGIGVRARGKDARRRIGYVPQTPALNDGDTCEQGLSFLAEIKGAAKSRIPAVLDLVNLAPQRATRVGHLSGGMRQRLALAAALLSDPPLLLLDEPTASLDAESRRDLTQMIRRLREEGRTIILSTHFFDHLEDVADRALILRDGRLAFDGSLAELAGRVSSNRYIVNLNGNQPSDLLRALTEVGIGPDRVQKAELRWDEIMLASTESSGDDAPAGGEAR